MIGDEGKVTPAISSAKTQGNITLSRNGG